MAYYLTVEKKRGEYTPLDITKSIYFSRISNLKGMGMTLPEIDLFTMMFDNEKELRSALIKEKFLEMKYASKTLSVRRLDRGKYKKVTYDFLYQKDIEYIMNPSKIIAKINDKLESGDYRFVEKFANRYLQYHECASTAAEVRNFASSSIKLNCMDSHFNDLDENYDTPLIRMAKLLIYEYHQSPSGRVEYSGNITYRNLHSIVAFVNNYDKKYQSEEIEANNQINLFTSDDNKQLSFFDISKIEKTTTKKKSLKLPKRKYIEGQLNIFNE